MLEHYMQRWPPSKDEFDIVATETRFEVPVLTRRSRSSTKFFAAGRFDGVIIDKHGDYWLLEHKTYKTIDDDNLTFLELDSQAGVYLLAAQMMYGVEFRGILYNVLRKKIPTVPHLLKRGGLSVAKDIDTTYKVYLQSIHDYGYNPADYDDILERLLTKGNTFFRRFRVRRTQRELQWLMLHLYSVAREMTNPHVRIYPTDHWMECKRCGFREACLARLGGYDYRAVLETTCRPRRERIHFDLANYQASVAGVTEVPEPLSVTFV